LVSYFDVDKTPCKQRQRHQTGHQGLGSGLWVGLRSELRLYLVLQFRFYKGLGLALAVRESRHRTCKTSYTEKHQTGKNRVRVRDTSSDLNIPENDQKMMRRPYGVSQSL
jgi:hypothetical protein